MREIKFRGLTVNGEWHCGNLSVLKQKVNNVEAGSYISNEAGLPFAYQIRPETASEFTGRHDKNGQEIYEGDIVLTWGEGGEGDDGSEESKEVVFDDIGQWYWGNNGGNSFPLYELDQDFMLVIGNIHDNADLLKS